MGRSGKIAAGKQPRPRQRTGRRALLTWSCALGAVGLGSVGPELSRAVAQTSVTQEATSNGTEDTQARLATLEARTAELEQSLSGIRPVAGGAALTLVPLDTARRLRDAQALFAVKNYAATTVLLWDVVERGSLPGTTVPELPEAIFLLAESLFLQGEHRAAQRLYVQLVDLPGTVRSQQQQAALLRLLECATQLRSDERAEEWLTRLGNIPAAEQLPGSAYGRGKYQFFRAAYANVLPLMQAVPDGNPYALRARYFVGAAYVGLGKLAEAEAVFAAITARPQPVSDDDRRVVELSHMALGRIYHELGQSDKAHASYLRISQKSNLFKDAIYEAAWSAIRAKDFERAERSLELLLLAYRDAPQTTYAAAEAKMLLGNMLLRRGEPDAALGWFEQTRTELKPLLDKLSELLGQQGDVKSRVRALIEQNQRSFELSQVAPPSVQPLLQGELEVQRFLAMQRDLTVTQRALDEMEAAITRLDKQLQAARFRLAPELMSSRARSYVLFKELFQLHLLTGAQLDALVATVATPEEGESLRALVTKRAQLNRSLAEVSAGDSDILDATSAIRRAQSELLQQEQATWQALSGRLSGPAQARAAALQQEAARLGVQDSKLQALSGRLDRLLDVKVAEVQSTVVGEREKLRSYREALAALGRESANLGGETLGGSGQQAARRFAEVMVRADAGVVDVAWAKKVQTSDHVAQLASDSKREIKVLDEEFNPSGEQKSAAKPASTSATTSEPASAATASRSEKEGKENDLPPIPADLPPEIAGDYLRWVESARSYRSTVDEYAQAAYRERREQLSTRYATQIRRKEQAERDRRTQAIAQFEGFVGKYPQHARFTPDALFRLAELYFEGANESFVSAAKQVGGESVGLPDYSRSIGLYRRVLSEFPGYRNSDGAHYLLGYCLGEMGNDREALQAYLGLVCTNKYQALAAPLELSKEALHSSKLYDGCVARKGDSRFLAESWIRVGEHHFDRAELEPAIYAYSQVLPFTESPFFDKALYKLAWSFYRADRFSDAVRRFDELVVLADRKKTNAAGVQKATGSSLRQESVQYLALSFTERDWDGDGRDDAESGLSRLQKFYQGREDEAHVREVVAKMGDLLFERTEFARAAAAYKLAITRWPTAPGNPKLQERIVAAYERQRLFEQALRERESLAKNYLDGTDWYAKNRDNPDALERAQELADAALMNAVLRRHDSAQELRQKAQKSKDPKLLAQAQADYRRAAESYETYLTQHPRGKNAYEYGYYYAESLFYGEKFAEAAAAYERTRDQDPAGKYLEDAAYGAIKAREEVVAALYKSKSALEPPLPTVGAVQSPVVSLPVPEVVSKLQTAYDRFVVLVPQSDKTPLLAYKAAEIDFRYLRFLAARPRMEMILSKFCKDERAVDAGNALLVSYTIENDLEKIEEWTGKLKALSCGGKSQLAATQAGNIQKLSAQVRFKKAELLLEQKQFAAAASMFVEIVDADPKAADSDKALFNAAVASENLKRYGAATALYERVVRDYPQSSLLDDSLFRSAVNHQRFFDFDKAVVAYKALATEARFKASSHRHDALYNAALISDNDQSYAQAIELWKQYARDEKTPPDEARQALFRAALAVEKLGPAARAEQEQQQFVSKFGKDPQALAQVVELQARIAKLQLQQRNPIDATESLKKTAQLGAKLPAGSDGAEFAAEASFQLAERRLADIEKQRISGSGKELENTISDFNRRVNEAVVEYDKVLGYRRANWTLAAYFRMGYVFELYAKALLGAPCPPEVKRLGAEACDLYRTKIEENVAGIEDKAVARYKVTLEQAGRLGVANQWTKLARVRANAYRPDVYPLSKDEHVAQQLLLDGIVAQRSSSSGSEAEQQNTEAQTALQAGQYENAMVMAKLALQKDDRYVPAMLTLAKAYYSVGKRELAAAVIEVAQSIDATSAESYVVLGFLALAKEDRIAATAAFKKATELDGQSGLAWHNLAAQYLLAKNSEQALVAAQRAMALLPGSSGAMLNLGSAQRAVGRFAEAAETYRQLLTRDGQNADAYYNLGILHLDAPNLSGMDFVTQRNTAIGYLQRYQQLSGARGRSDDSAEAYIKEAKAAIEREQRKQQRQKKTTGQLESGSQAASELQLADAQLGNRQLTDGSPQQHRETMP